MCTVLVLSHHCSAQNIFLTGQHAQYHGFEARLYNSIRATQPVSMPVRVIKANDVRFDAWKGMRKWSLEENKAFLQASISRTDYEEKGGEWFKEHRFASNLGGE